MIKNIFMRSFQTGEVNETDHESNLPLRFRQLAATVLGLTTLVAPTNTLRAKFTNKTPPSNEYVVSPGNYAPAMEFTGFVENRLLNDDLDKARAIATKIKENNGNSVLVALPWTYPWQAEVVKDDIKRFCNAARAAYEHQLNLFVTFYPYKIDKDGSVDLGFPASRYQQITRFGTAIINSISGIKNNPECAPNTSRIFIIPENEPNYGVFRRNQYDSDGNWIAPRQAAELQTRIYRMLKAEQQKLNMQIIVLGGALSSSKDPVSFVRGMEGALLDGFAYHPYNDVEDQSKVIAAVKDTFGAGMPIINTEYGFETRGESETQSKLEERQAQAIGRAIAKTACQKIIGFFNFHLKDKDDRDDLKTGVYDARSKPKAAQAVVSQLYNDARAGNIKC